MGLNKEIMINGLVTIVMVWIALATYDKFVAPFIGGAIGKAKESAEKAEKSAEVAKVASTVSATKA